MIKKYREADEVKYAGSLSENLMQTGILEPDEYGMSLNMEKIIAENKLQNQINDLVIGLITSFIHQFVSKIEALTIRVINKLGYNEDEFDRNAFYGIFEARYTGLTGEKINLRDISSFAFYGRLYDIWNFLKHNTISTYQKLLKDYPEMLFTKEDIGHDYSNGELASNWIKFDLECINNTIKGLRTFFEDLCRICLGEDSEEANWNYDDYFVGLVKNKISDDTESYENPLGLPWWL